VAYRLGYGGSIFNILFVVIFSLYIGYDWHVAQSYSKTVDNAIDSAIDLYLDLINLFIRILDLLDN
ncbi:MAG: Bax inhibitor-1 family protein, partial [Clostridia bacterium]|nr:Bax inhibitor-1 family protein [Clostridia bacterium]